MPALERKRTCDTVVLSAAGIISLILARLQFFGKAGLRRAAIAEPSISRYHTDDAEL